MTAAPLTVDAGRGTAWRPVARPLREAAAPRNVLTVDVEDWFQVSALAPHIDRGTWDARDCRVERNVARLLEMFERHGARGTFFTLGWIAERHPQVVRDIVAAGHELASHGHGHERVFELSPEAFRQDLLRAKGVLEDLGGRAVVGYRAPSFSIDHRNPWAHDLLEATGHRYSSSVYPVRHDHYGMPDAPRTPFRVRPGLLEIPVTTTRLWGRNLPAGGGGYFRLAPYRLSRWAVRRVNRVDAMPSIFYMHPWEIDPAQPRVDGTGLKTRFRHYVNLSRTADRLERLLGDFRWGRMDEVFDLEAA
jgi:polysaccharide deacetylase family protein (PEP-CTERM system associated)